MVQPGPRQPEKVTPKKTNGDISSARWGERVRMWMFFVLNIDIVDGRNPANHLLSSLKPYEKCGITMITYLLNDANMSL